jgi:hypothetical protein
MRFVTNSLVDVVMVRAIWFVSTQLVELVKFADTHAQTPRQSTKHGNMLSKTEHACAT